MDWTRNMNTAIDYIEAHLTDTVDEHEISKIMGCSYASFQNSFTQLSGISVSEYIRRRRLTLAAAELQNTDHRVLDIALKYGYQSADAFRVAFLNLHGLTPSAARNSSVRLTFYCRIHFEVNITGIDRMQYQICSRESFQVIGVRRTTPYGGGTWAVVKADGSNDRINLLCGKFFDLGLCFGFGEDGSNDYMCAIEWDGEDSMGFERYTYAPATWLIFEARGKISDQTLFHVWQRINHEFLPQSKYRKSGQPTIEKYILWDETKDFCHVEIMIPVTL